MQFICQNDAIKEKDLNDPQAPQRSLSIPITSVSVSWLSILKKNLFFNPNFHALVWASRRWPKEYFSPKRQQEWLHLEFIYYSTPGRLNEVSSAI